MDTISLVFGICCFILILSCCTSSILWFYQADILNDESMCVVDTSTDPNNYAYYLCPLNQSIVTNILGIKSGIYHNEKYIQNVKKHFNDGTFKLSELFNTHYSSGTPPPTSGDIVYCNKNYTVCESTKSPGSYNTISYVGPLILKPYGIYTITNPDNSTGFYMDNAMILRLSSKIYSNINDFLKDVDTFQKEHIECLNYYNLQKTVDENGRKLDYEILANNKIETNALSLKCIFFKDPTVMIKTFVNALLVGLSQQLLINYLSILQNKRETNTMTTFDYFAYFAVISKLNNINELILTTKS